MSTIDDVRIFANDRQTHWTRRQLPFVDANMHTLYGLSQMYGLFFIDLVVSCSTNGITYKYVVVVVST